MLPSHCHRRVRVTEQADLSAVRCTAADLAAAAALGDEAAGRVQLVVCELATNLLRHARGGGVILMRQLGLPGEASEGFECIALDQGPGIEDLGRALADRHDPEPVAGRGLGYGLGAVRRLSDGFDIHSIPGTGTAVLARVHAAAPVPADTADGPRPGWAFEWGAVMLPMAGDDHCGDGWLIRPDGLVMVVDGLGHGEAASLAARRAEDVARRTTAHHDPQAVLSAMHEALRGTRGAVAAALRVGHGRIDYACVGNIVATIVRRDGTTSLPERWGVIGYNAVPPASTTAPWGAGEHVILHSDGCSRVVDLFVERRLRHVDPALAAAVLLRDGGTRVDDQTVVVLRNTHPAPHAFL
ncbi:MAG TPA: ATP-binding protein [Azospirillum sp.]